MPHSIVRKSLALIGASALALSLSACGPDDAAQTPPLFGLGNADGAYDFALGDDFGGFGNFGGYQDDYGNGGDGYAFADALPLRAGGYSDYGNYGAAPAWDYSAGGYNYDVPYGDWGRYDEGFADQYYDSYYDDDPFYYDQNAGSDQYT